MYQFFDKFKQSYRITTFDSHFPLRKIMPAVSVPSDVSNFHLFSFIFALIKLIQVTWLTPIKNFSEGVFHFSFTSSNLWKICTQFSKEFRRWGLLINIFFSIIFLKATCVEFSAFFHLLQGLDSAWITQGVGLSLVRIVAMQEKLTCRKTHPPVNALLSRNSHWIWHNLLDVLCILLCQRTILYHGVMHGISSLCISINSRSKHNLSVHSPGAKPSKQHPYM